MDLTEDRLLGGRVAIRQPRKGFRATIESVLLAAAVPASDGETVLEPGAGAGAAALCLAARVEGCRVVGLEISPDLVRLAGENAQLNGLERRIDMMVGDVARPPPRLAPAGYDHVMMNPPFLAAGRSDAPAEPALASARVEAAGGLAAWLAFAGRMLRPKGTLTLVHRADRLADVLGALGPAMGAIVVFPLWPDAAGAPAKRMLVRARRGARGPLRLARGLALHRAGGAFTEAADAVLRGAALDL